MLQDHKNFHFRPVLDKTDDLIFFKSTKTLLCPDFNIILGISHKILYIFFKQSGTVNFHSLWF